MQRTLSRWLDLGKTKLDWHDWLLLPFPFLIFFSYQPLISFGRGENMTHYEVSLIELYLLAYVLAWLPRLWQQRQAFLKHRAAQLAGLFALYNTLSILWTPDRARAILTAGIIWLLVLFFYTLLVNKNLKALAAPLVRVFIMSAVLMSLFALYQMAAGSTPALTNASLLCPGCEASQLGFARPNGFAIEPQFFGSLLLAPTLILLYLVMRKKQPLIVHLALGLLVTTLVLTLSRGALYSLAAGILVLAVVERASYRRFLIPAGVMALSLASALVIQGTAAQLNPNVSDTFLQAIAKSINQLTLGKVSLPVPRQPEPVQPTPIPIPTQSVLRPAFIPTAPAIYYSKAITPSIFNGYIERSTSERVESSCLAFGAWTNSPTHTVFGVGLGGTGHYFLVEPTRSHALWCKTNT